MKLAPDHHDAELIIKYYDLRREPVMRASRVAMNQKFWPKTWDEFVAYTKADHEINAAYRQVSTYWEMVYGAAKWGVVHADMLAEASGEGMFVFARVHPFLDRIRTEMSPTAFQNAEWMTRNSAVAKRQFTMFEARVKKTLESR